MEKQKLVSIQGTTESKIKSNSYSHKKIRAVTNTIIYFVASYHRTCQP